MRLVLPEKYRLKSMQGCHNDFGHLVLERMIDLLCDRFYWPSMHIGVEQHIKNCCRCLKFKSTPQREELHPILATNPLELVHMDYLTIENPKGERDINMLVMTDNFTRYAQAIVTSSHTAKVTTQALWNNFIGHYGIPSSLLCDQGEIPKAT